MAFQIVGRSGFGRHELHADATRKALQCTTQDECVVSGNRRGSGNFMQEW
jgi:hypothetical protein